MILFQTNTAQIDLTHLRPTLIEESDWFVNDTTQNYSLPFTMDFNNEVAQQLGLAHIKNISAYKRVITGTLIIDDDFYTAYIKLGEIQGNFAEATLFYGDHVLPVFKKKLKDIGWPIIFTETGLADYAENLVDIEYPETSHNFPVIYRPSIKEKEDYSKFLNFVNYYAGGNFLENFSVLEGGETVFYNQNVMAPCTYMLEILRHGYKQEGKEVRGELFESDLFKKVIYIPEQFFERFLSNQYDAFSFTFASTFQTVNGVELAVFEKVYIPTSLGTYDLKFKVNLSASQAKTFSLIITTRNTATQELTTIYSATSSQKNVNIDKELEINVDTDNVFDQIRIELIIPRQTYSMETYNSFEYNYKSGRLNVFPTQYSLSDFMPDMTFGQYVNHLKDWLNLDIVTVDNIVYYNFVENKLQNLEIESKSQLEDPDKKHVLNTDRFYKIKYLNDETLNVDTNGQVFADPNEHQEEIPLDMAIYPLKVDDNFGRLTGVFPEDTSGLRFGIYNGLQPVSGGNVLIDTLDGATLSLEDNYALRWKNWLTFRTNSKTFIDNALVHFSEHFDLRKAMLKYNELHLIKKISKKRTSAKYWKIETETETL